MSSANLRVMSDDSKDEGYDPLAAPDLIDLLGQEDIGDETIEAFMTASTDPNQFISSGLLDRKWVRMRPGEVERYTVDSVVDGVTVARNPFAGNVFTGPKPGPTFTLKSPLQILKRFLDTTLVDYLVGCMNRGLSANSSASR
jgi:hypothetical protein